jgi:hypothetical protein
MSMINIETTTWLDHLPAEIIFLILNYLSNNDIIYTFFFLNQRFNNLLLQNQRYLNHLELPTANLNTWENILSIIASQIESLQISTSHLSFPITYFLNLKSIVISSPFGLPDEEFKSSIKSYQFQNLHSFKIKELTDRPYGSASPNEHHRFKKVWNHNNSLKTLQYSLIIPAFVVHDLNSFETNYNLHSLTIILTDFQDIFTLISYTPNLKYLNVQSKLPYIYDTPIDRTEVKLEKLCLTLRWTPGLGQIGFYQLIDGIKQFSSTLRCLSLNLVNVDMLYDDRYQFNSIEFQQLLESMIELKQFHLYARVDQWSENSSSILSQFQTQYWIDHNLSFGMHRNYFYTLPFYFDSFYDFIFGFNDVKSSNPEILTDNPRIWYNVKSIEISTASKYDVNFVKQLKTKMPKLTFIKFGAITTNDINKIQDIDAKNDEREKIQTTLDYMTTIECTGGSVENEKEWLIYALPNLTHLILHCGLSVINSQLTEILNKRIQRLDITEYSQLKQCIEISYIYFSNVQYINCYMDSSNWPEPKQYADNVMKILIKFKNLKTLLIYTNLKYISYRDPRSTTKLSKLIECLNMKKIEKNYQVKYYHEYLLFSKHEFSDNIIQSGIVSSILRKLSFFHRKN